QAASRPRRSTRRWLRSLPACWSASRRFRLRPTSTVSRSRVKPMPTQVLMPALSPTMEKGNLAKWVKSEGDKVKAGDVIAEIETDKATMEVEAVDEGTLGKILVPEGTADVAVNTPIAVILSDGESAADIQAGAAPAAQEKGAESAPPAEPEKKTDAPEVAHKSAAAPVVEAQPEPDVPEGTEMVTIT